MPSENNSIPNFFNNASTISNNYPQLYAPLFAAASNPAAAAAAAVALFNSTSSIASTSTFSCPTVTSTVNLNSTPNISKYQQQQISVLEQQQTNFNQQQQLQLQRQLLAVAAFKQQFAAALGAASINSSPTLSSMSYPNFSSKVEISSQNLH